MEKHVVFQKGEEIIKEKTFGTSAYIIKRGRVEVSKAKEPSGTKLVLAVLGKGEIFGELGLIEDKPRSATVTALDEVEVSVIDRARFTKLLSEKPLILVPIIKVLFERLRQMNEMLLLKEENPPVLARAAAETHKVILQPLSEESQTAINGPELVIVKFPFKIGRKVDERKHDVFYYNDLSLPDTKPYNVSTSHLSITPLNDKFYIVDSGSRLGTIVNGVTVGGPLGRRTAALEQYENELIIGTKASPYRFKIIIEELGGDAKD